MQLNVQGSFALYKTCANKRINKSKILKMREKAGEREEERKEGKGLERQTQTLGNYHRIMGN